MSTGKGASLRRQQRHNNTPNVSQGCDAPISLVFRTHSEGLSKAAFLFCPKNFNLANPTTTGATRATVVNSGSASSLGGGMRHIVGAAAAAAAPTHDTSSASPVNPKRCAASTSQTISAAAASSSTESVQTLVEAIIELRPSFATSAFRPSNSTVNLAASPPASPLLSTANITHLGQSPSSQSLMARPVSNASLGLGSYVDLMSLSSFASPTASGGGGSTVGNGSFSISATASANSGRYGERLHTVFSSRGAAAAAVGGGSQGPPLSSIAHGGGGGVMGGGVRTASGSPSARSLSGSTGQRSGGAHDTFAGFLMHPSGGWICRAMAFNEKDVNHANGAISVNQSLTSKCPLINEVAKGKTMARILSSYQDVQERYGLSHVEVTVENQYVSRSDFFLISEALRERILYEGEEIHICNFRIRVREMLQAAAGAVAPVSGSPAIPITTPTTASTSATGNAVNAASNTISSNNGNNNTATAATNATSAATSYVRVGCGLVLPTTRINFQSLSPVHYILVELSREMWDTTIDGRIALTWAIRKFISELLLKQLPKRKASPLIRVVFTGRLQQEFQFGRHRDIFHLLELPREARNIDVVEEIRMHCEALVDRVLREVQTTAYQELAAEVAAYCEGRAGRDGNSSDPDAQGKTGAGLAEGNGGMNSSPQGFFTSTVTAAQPFDRDAVFDAYVRHRQACIDGITAKHLFMHARQSNTLEALSILLERCNHHYIDRHLTLCGHAVTVVSAGKGFYQVTNSLVQIVCARVHDMGLEKVHVVCIGRPPLHVTPLLEYTSDDETLRSQYHLHSRFLSSTGSHRSGPWATVAAEVERYYETPEWISVFFFHPALNNNGGEAVFELLPKECWQRGHPMMSVFDTVWSPQESQLHQLQQQQLSQPQQTRASPSFTGDAFSGKPGKTLLNSAQATGDSGDGGEGDGHNGAFAMCSSRGGQHPGEVMTLAAVKGCAQSYEAMSPGGCVGCVGAAQSLASAAAVAANPPLLIPGLGLHSYPVSEVTLPVSAATAASADLFVGLWGRDFDVLSIEDKPMGVVASEVTRTRTARHYPYDSLEMSGTASHGTDPVTSPLSPFSQHPHFGKNMSAFAATAGRVSPFFSTGGTTSSPLLVRTTTAGSSVFASPNLPGRGSIQRGGGGATASAWREHHHPLPGLNNRDNIFHQHLDCPLHLPQVRQHSGATANTGDVGGLRRGDAGTCGSAQRRLRGGDCSAGVGRIPTPLYMSSSSVAVPAFGLGGNDGNSRQSHSNRLASYGTSSQPPLHVSSSFDCKTTANPTFHSLGAFENSVSSAGSSLVSRCTQMRSLLHREGSEAKSSLNFITAHSTTAGGANAAAWDDSRVGARLGGGGLDGPAAVCSWYCLHAAKLHQEGGSGFTTSAAASGGAPAVAATAGGAFARTFLHRSGETGAAGHARVSPCEDVLHENAAASDAAAARSSLHLGGGLHAALQAAKSWHKPRTSTRADAVFCGCNVVDSDLRNGYLILEIAIDAALLPTCFWSPRVLLDDQGWSELMSCFTGRDDRLTGDTDAAFTTRADLDGDDSVAIDGGRSTAGYFAAADGAATENAARATSGTAGSSAPSHVRSDGNTEADEEEDGHPGSSGDVYHFQSDFRAAEVFCRLHSGISADGRTLILPTHNNSVHFQSSEEILLRLQPQFFVTSVDDGGNAALEGCEPVSPILLHSLPVVMDKDEGGGGGGDDSALTTQTTTMTGLHKGGEASTFAAADTEATVTLATLAATDDRKLRSSSGAENARGVVPTDVPTPLVDARAAATGAAATAAMLRPVPLQLPPVPAGTSTNAASAEPVLDFPDRVPVQQGTGDSGVRRPETGAHVFSSPCYVAHAAAEAVSTTATVPVGGAVVRVGFVQLRNSLLFAIKPINPLRPSAEEELCEDVTAPSQSAESASTATVLRRRWQWKHPDIALEPPHLASWTRLCTCRLLPLYGSKPAYPREGFYTVSPHQYTVSNPRATGGHADPADEKRRLLEFVLQRLQQQYQIVVDAPGLAAGAQWPRADPSPNARLEMSLGHQTHTLKVGETAKTISITRMLHRGMYSNGQVTHMLSYRYLLWNYLADEFTPREVHMEAQVGERNAFSWESLDRWLQERPEVYIPRGPDLWLRSREVAVILLPEDPDNPPSFDEFCRFIGYRFSVHLSTHGKVEWVRHCSGVTIDIPKTIPFVSFPPAPSLMDVVLVHDNPLTLDTRNVMDRVTGRTVAFEVPVEERCMSVDVSLPKHYDPQCCYFLKVSWLACAAPLVVDWFGSLIANASRFHLHAVPMACYYNSPKAESLTTHYDVEAASAEEEPRLRRALAELLIALPYRYYPDTSTITRNCRLVHLSGLCCVIFPPSATIVAQWYQNACLRQGSVEQLQLLVQFKEAEALARKRVASSKGGTHT